MDEQEQQSESQVEPTPLSTPPSHKKMIIGIVTVFALVVVVSVGIYFVLQDKSQSTTQPIDDTTLPDLVITDVKINKVRKKTSNIYSSDFIVTIQNKGLGDVTEAFVICMWDDEFRSIDKNQCNNGKLTNYDHEKMAPAVLEVGSRIEVVFESINLSTLGKKYYFEVDKSNDQSDNSVRELDETNNTFSIIFNVTE